MFKLIILRMGYEYKMFYYLIKKPSFKRKIKNLNLNIFYHK
jgi:hypothetical protein